MKLSSVAARAAAWTAGWRRFSPWSAVLGLAAAMALAGCGSPEKYPQTALFPLSEYARIGDAIQDQTLYWAIGVFILVEGALLYAMFRFRGKPNDPEPKQIHGNTAIEIVWTLIPALILAAIAVPTVRGIFKMNETPKGDVLVVEIIGHQWWWEFRYPEYKIVTANQLYIPVGKTVAFKQQSADVIHSFWAPRFAGKRDVFPGRETRLWFKAEAAGEYPGQCAEFCGLQHGRMSFRIMAQEPADFDKWVAHMQSLGPPAPAVAVSAVPDSLHTASVGDVVQPGKNRDAKPQDAKQQEPAPPPAPVPPADPLYARGESLFKGKGTCFACHSIQAHEPPPGMIGPNLANVGARTWIGAGTLPNTPENLARWIHNPQVIKVGVGMPNLGLSEDEARALAAFLRAHQ